MMKTSTAAIFLAIIGSALAAPVVVWRKGEAGTPPVRTSKTLRSSDLLADVLSVNEDAASLASVVFVLGRGQDGSESLSTMAAAGVLPNVSEKYSNAYAIHHHVSGVESPSSLEKDAVRSTAGTGHKVLSISLGELNTRLTSHTEPMDVEVTQNGVMSKTAKHNHKRAQDLSDATVLIVTVDPRVDGGFESTLDNAIVGAIDHGSVGSVVLTAVRSHDEVKHERLVEHNRRLSLMKNAGSPSSNNGRRRLEDQQQQEGENANNQNAKNNGEDMTGVYYVSMTPNILAGILFTLLFTVTTWIGVTCMGMISGQDVYVKKMPPVGREA